MPAENLSGVPPVVTLSGIPGATSSLSGQQQPSFSGQGGAQQGAATPGMTGGLDLMQLLALLGQGGGLQGGPGTDAGLTAGLGAGSFGQGQGFGSSGGFSPGGPMGGQSQLAGQTGQQSATSGAGSLDPAAVIQKTLGLLQKGASLLGGASTASPTMGEGGGTSMSDQVRSQQGGAGGVTASPVMGSPYGTIDPQTGLPLPGTQSQPTMGPGGVPTTGFGELPGGGTGGQDPANLQFLNQFSGAQIPPELAALGVTQENLPQFMQAAGAWQPGAPGTAMQAGSAALGAEGGMGGLGGGSGAPPGGLGGAAGGAGGLSGTNIGGAVSGGLGGLQGLLAAIQALQGQGGDLSKALGTIQGLGGAAAGGAGLSDALGLTSGLGGTVGGFAAPAGVLAQIAQLLGGGYQNPEQLNASATQAGITGITAPIAGAASAAAAAAAPAGSTLAALAPVLSAISGPLAFAAPVLGTIMAIMQATSKPGNRDINRFTGVQGPQTTQALESVAGLTPQGTDFAKIPTDILERLIPAEGNVLERYYNRDIPEDRYLTGLQASGSPEFGQVQSALNTDRTALLQSIAQLQQRGIGNDVLGNLLTPQLNNIAQMNNSDWMGMSGYTSPAANMQQYGFGSNEQLAGAYGGPTWLALQNIFGPGLGQALGQYGGTAPGFTAPAPPTDPMALQAAAQYAPPYQDLSGPQA